MAEWSGGPVSLPGICRLRVRFPSPPGRATFPTTRASVTVIHYKRMAVTGMNLNARGYGRKLATTLTRPKAPIIIIICLVYLTTICKHCSGLQKIVPMSFKPQLLHVFSRGEFPTQLACQVPHQLRSLNCANFSLGPLSSMTFQVF